MNKVILSGVLLSLLCSSAFAQKDSAPPKTKCNLSLDQSPELRGLRLGMTQAAVLARFPGVSIEKPDKFGLARLRLSVIESSSLIKGATREKSVQPDITAGQAEGTAFVIDSVRFPALKGVRKMQLRFIDDRLSYLGLSYDDAVKWESIDQLVETISGTLKLPNEWQTPADSDGSGQEKELRCEAFALSASTSADPTDIHAGPELILQDLAAWNAMSKRQNDLVEKARQNEDAKRKAFKP
jgi:hypothetical protein